ncbi:hypothetical protein FHX49_001107 [Microbacterium endophyticum]|uniref:Uncharacterized protein n=1 Tax=Microbacterium endophyticum TaxID=1526412 RepID=A0A7W4V289_9MICO|nr:hypothetical protein [Microbacterium endophyticum]MBB2975541.1 hypothetical protein [Microbacterium endophyticum]NIK35440.1 hypothetical protein [Microbacterium endophyticum]
MQVIIEQYLIRVDFRPLGAMLFGWSRTGLSGDTRALVARLF